MFVKGESVENVFHPNIYITYPLNLSSVSSVSTILGQPVSQRVWWNLGLAGNIRVSTDEEERASTQTTKNEPQHGRRRTSVNTDEEERASTQTKKNVNIDEDTRPSTQTEKNERLHRLRRTR